MKGTERLGERKGQAVRTDTEANYRFDSERKVAMMR